jgi:hypothetical protein
MITMTEPSFLAALSLLAFPLDATGQQPVREVLADPAMDMKRPADREKAVRKVRDIEDKRLANARPKGRALGLALRVEMPGGNLLRSSPQTLDDPGLIVGLWDAAGGWATHQEFATGSRLTNMNGTAMHYHSMHVAGAIGALGVNSSARGMANAVKINCYDWNNHTSEVLAAGATTPVADGGVAVPPKFLRVRVPNE